MNAPIVELSEVSRRFGAKEALGSVSLTLEKGAVHGLVVPTKPSCGNGAIRERSRFIWSLRQPTLKFFSTRFERAARFLGFSLGARDQSNGLEV